MSTHGVSAQPLGGDLPETAVVMPVYNEATVVRGVIEDLVGLGLTVIAVDDGSSDSSAAEIDAAGAIRVSHPINLGQGGALQTGVEAALRFTGAKYVATFDADGQHQSADLVGMISKAEEGGYDVVLGSRFLDGKTEMSGLRRLILKTATKVFNRGSAHKLTDAHNGLRLVTRDVAARINLVFAGMAHASELEQELTQSIYRVAEYPVHVLYTEYSRSKGQPLLNSVNILGDILAHRVGTWSRA
ncbi:Glycosyltransferase involved in cell wall bisynthesis [Geodermatophilus obscurus]|uniref:Glycosyltransferase involved in cell wall bisynthesis n=1 Tax=Geodermatophilus obscurus TaxID=1861 RepID=A0A1M7UQQ1_9ACTN|nr:glycosyltransferase family 2 protein [Geodermatophilus obscurus]SHN85216.1 Glycosyltransferase involved in cell wall bisynthesis [Geodermatophilus obscurus]